MLRRLSQTLAVASVFSLATTVASLSAQKAPSAKPAAAPSPSTPLPVDPKVRMGVLPNGIHYYIRQNKKPENRAELRLVVNAGSVLETDNQLGLAHFIEHMAFNGTTHFAKNDLIHYLQSIGVRFGADLNANTDFDETVYILPIPTDTARIVDQAFTILDDWAHGETLDSTEVANERGVVREEWRLGKGAADRMLHEWLPIALRGSRYADRLPIGNEQSIMTATPARLRSFYQAWYRPDLEAVIAVGDFDPAAIEAQIKKHFADIPKASPNAPKRTLATVPSNKAPLIGIASDKEAQGSDVDLIFKLPVETTRTVGDYRRDLAERLYLRMLNNRLEEIAQKPDAPFLGADASKGTFIGRTTDAFTLSADVKDGGIPQGLEAILLEAKRVDEHGFLPSELDRAKQSMLRGYEQAYTERDKTQSAAFVQEYIQNYLMREPIPGIEYEYKLAQELVPSITVDQINKMASNWITDTNRVIIAESPLKDGVKVPTRDELLAVFDKAAKEKVAPYTENLATGGLIASAPTAGTIVSGRQVPSLNLTEWTLSNGARVLVKPTDFKADEVLFSAQSPGGTSIASNPDFMSASLASQIVQLSGLGQFNRVDLGKKLAGKVAGVAPSISDDGEAVSGRASPKDLETLFQLIYLNFTAPRLDTAAYQAFQNQVGPFLANRGTDPDQVFSDSVQWTMSQHNFRARPVTPATFAEVDPAKALQFYKDRFADASGFTFMFVGNVDTTALKPLVERYIASLPSTGRKETFKDVGAAPPRGVIDMTVHKGVEPKANTQFEFTGACQYTPENRFAMRAMVELLQIRLDDIIREQLGGAYSPSASGACSRTPRQEYDITVQYNSSPDNVEKLSKAVMQIVDSLKNHPADAAEVNKVREELRRGREVDIKQNAYWLGNILGRTEAGEDITGLLGAYDDMIKNLSAAQIQEAARKYFDTNNYARFILLPESKATTHPVP